MYYLLLFLNSVAIPIEAKRLPLRPSSRPWRLSSTVAALIGQRPAGGSLALGPLRSVLEIKTEILPNRQKMEKRKEKEKISQPTTRRTTIPTTETRKGATLIMAGFKLLLRPTWLKPDTSVPLHVLLQWSAACEDHLSNDATQHH